MLLVKRAFVALVILAPAPYGVGSHSSLSEWLRVHYVAPKSGANLRAGLLRAVHVVNSRTAYAGGARGSMLRTTNGGASWDSVSVESSTIVRGIVFMDTVIGIAVDQDGGIHRTVDGGTTWQKQRPPTAGALLAITRVSGDVPAIIMTGGRGRIFRSHDAGATWNLVASHTIAPLTGVRFGPRGLGYVVGGGGVILRSSDAGKSWSRLRTGNFAAFNEVAVLDDRTAFAAGTNGTILITRDAGRTWKRGTSGTREHLTGVVATGPRSAVVAGFRGVLLETSDGGATWRQVRSGTPDHLYALDTDGRVVLAAGWNQTILRAELGGARP